MRVCGLAVGCCTLSRSLSLCLVGCGEGGREFRGREQRETTGDEEREGTRKEV